MLAKSIEMNHNIFDSIITESEEKMIKLTD